jgi:N12 class adenine-specific DNA methylase
MKRVQLYNYSFNNVLSQRFDQQQQQHQAKAAAAAASSLRPHFRGILSAIIPD